MLASMIQTRLGRQIIVRDEKPIITAATSARTASADDPDEVIVVTPLVIDAGRVPGMAVYRGVNEIESKRSRSACDQLVAQPLSPPASKHSEVAPQ